MKFQENIKIISVFCSSGKNENPKKYVEVYPESLPGGEHIVVSAHDKQGRYLVLLRQSLVSQESETAHIGFILAHMTGTICNYSICCLVLIDVYGLRKTYDLHLWW